MSSLEAYSQKSFGNSACDGVLPPELVPPPQNSHARTIAEAIRRNGLSEAKVAAALDRIKAAELWLGPIGLGDVEVSV